MPMMRYSRWSTNLQLRWDIKIGLLAVDWWPEYRPIGRFWAGAGRKNAGDCCSCPREPVARYDRWCNYGAIDVQHPMRYDRWRWHRTAYSGETQWKRSLFKFVIVEIVLLKIWSRSRLHVLTCLLGNVRIWCNLVRYADEIDQRRGRLPCTTRRWIGKLSTFNPLRIPRVHIGSLSCSEANISIFGVEVLSAEELTYCDMLLATERFKGSLSVKWTLYHEARP